MVSDSRRPVPSSASILKLLVEDGDGGDDLRRFSEFDLDTTTRLSSSVARRFAFGAARTPEHEFDVVIEGSVAQALSKRGREGRRRLLSLDLDDDSLSGKY